MARFVVAVPVEVDENTFAELTEAGRDTPDGIAGWLEHEVEDALKLRRALERGRPGHPRRGQGGRPMTRWARYGFTTNAHTATRSKPAP